jgi:acyl-CoA synthetase (AMP-forming)/AMP-acid ligase II
MPGETIKSGAQGIANLMGGAVQTYAGAVEAVGSEMKRPDRLARAAQVLVQSGIVRLERPDTALQIARTLLDWKLTPAAAFAVSAVRYPDDTAIVDEQGSLTFEEVERRTNKLAHAFAYEGVGRDDSVAIMCRDHRWFIEATVALSKLGATALYYNTAFAGPQLKEVTEREDPVAVVYDEEFTEVLKRAVGKRKRFVAWQDEAEHGEDTVEELIERGEDTEVEAPPTPGKITLLTSGSTGTPKGASRGQPDALEALVAILSRIPLKARDTTVFAAPLFHAWGFLQFNMGLLLSSTFVLRRKFDPEETLKAVEENQAQVLVVVPVMMQRILELHHSTRRKYDTDSLRVVAASGGAMPPELSEEWMDEFGDNLYNLYGSTEVAWAAIAGPADMREAPGTSGPPPPGTTLKILDQENRKEQPPNETGEVFVGNAMLFEGYTSGESEEMVDGHMSTGDLGYLDEDGRLFIEGRADDMIVSGGENVYPEEVEEALAAHKGVKEVAVIGVEDEDFGERLKAFVVKSGSVTEKALKDHVKSNLADYKVPREIEFIKELPRKPQGKVDKKALEEEEDDDG